MGVEGDLGWFKDERLDVGVGFVVDICPLREIVGDGMEEAAVGVAVEEDGFHGGAIAVARYSVLLICICMCKHFDHMWT